MPSMPSLRACLGISGLTCCGHATPMSWRPVGAAGGGGGAMTAGVGGGVCTDWMVGAEVCGGVTSGGGTNGGGGASCFTIGFFTRLGGGGGGGGGGGMITSWITAASSGFLTILRTSRPVPEMSSHRMIAWIRTTVPQPTIRRVGSTAPYRLDAFVWRLIGGTAHGR